MRQASLEDVPELVKLWEQAHGETSYSELEFSSLKMEQSLIEAVEENWFCCVIERDGQVIANYVGRIVNEFCSFDNVGQVVGFYVKPEYRTGRSAAYLIMNFIKWCKLNKCKQIRAGISSGNFSGDRLYRALGFKVVGFQYLLSVGV